MTFITAFVTPPLSEPVIPVNVVNVLVRNSTVKTIEPLYEDIEAYWLVTMTLSSRHLRSRLNLVKCFFTAMNIREKFVNMKQVKFNWITRKNSSI